MILHIVCVQVCRYFLKPLLPDDIMKASGNDYPDNYPNNYYMCLYVSLSYLRQLYNVIDILSAIDELTTNIQTRTSYLQFPMPRCKSRF